MVKAVMFDWDGTLYNSVVPTYKSYLNVMRAFSIPEASLQEFREKSRPNYHDYYLYLGIQEADWSTADSIWMDCYTRYRKQCALFSGTLEVLQELSETNVKIGLVSSGSRERVAREISEEGIAPYFDITLFGDDVAFEHAKPEPETLLMATRRARVPVSEVLYVGDMAEDILMGKKAGTKTAAVLCGFATRQTLVAAHPDFVLDDVSCLPKIMRKV
ncbi:MAG: HAD family hydrolase [Halobacteriota archaeon]